MRLLIADDDKVTRELLEEVFQREGYQTTTVSSGEEALYLLKKEIFPLILSDIRMLDVDWHDVLKFAKSSNENVIVILMTGFGTMDGAIEAIQDGAFGYISKPFRLDELKAIVDRAARHWQALQDTGPSADISVQGLASRMLIGKSPRIVDVYRTLARATLSPSNVLITGESGTGKELVARALHDHSPRRKGKFVAVNCSAIVETLLESELFGHVKGAFTGAIAHKEGLFETAHGGTLFLDEIGDISPATQVKLLRVLQEGECKRVGSSETYRVDARIIAATHRNLESFVNEGKFREDLYYRLKVIPIELPPLRERMEDLPELMNHFVGRFAERIGKNVSHVSEEAMRMLQTYGWPGNVRELEHAIERAVSMTRTTVLYPEDFPPEVAQGAVVSAEIKTPSPLHSLEDVERAHIVRVLEESNFNKSRAANLLGIDRKTLHRKAQRYGIRLPER